MNRARAVRGTRGSSSGAYVTGTLTYASTIDTSITNLKADYCYDAGFTGRRPILVMMHGYAEDLSAFITYHRWRFARRGFLVLLVAMRGRSGASGSRDASGREIHDIVDAVINARADGTLGPLVDADRVVIAGYSGGGGNTLGALAKAPDFWSYGVAYFPPSDYGWRTDSGWYYTDPGFQASLTTDIGAAPTAQPGWWRSRNHVDALGYQLALAPRRKMLSLYHDADDPTVDVAQSDRVLTVLTNAGLTHALDYNRSTSASVLRYEHGYPSDHIALETAEEDWWERALNADAWSVPVTGTVLVSGWIRTKRFSIWLGLTAAAGGSNPKTDSTGGKVHVARVEYSIDADGAGGTFEVLPLTGSLKVRIEVGATVSTTETADPVTVSL